MLKRVIGIIRFIIASLMALGIIYIAVFVTLIYLQIEGYNMRCKGKAAEHEIKMNCIGSIKL